MFAFVLLCIKLMNCLSVTCGDMLVWLCDLLCVWFCLFDSCCLWLLLFCYCVGLFIMG